MTTPFDSLYQQAGGQFGVDPDLLKAQGLIESSYNPNAVGPPTQYGQASGIAQMIPATAQSLGVTDPTDPQQAIMGQAKLMAENLKRYGDPSSAVMAYHGGTDESNWGPKTRDYHDKVAKAFQDIKSQQDAAPTDQTDPVLSFLQKGASEPSPQAPASGDPVLSFLSGDTPVAQGQSSASPAAQPQFDAQQGFLPALKRGFMGAGVGLNQLFNATDRAIQDNLPPAISVPLLHEYDTGTSPSPEELKARQTQLESMAADLKQQGQGTGFRGFAGEVLGNPLTYVPGEGPIGQGLAYGTADAFIGPKTNDTGLTGRATQAGWEAPLSAATSWATSKVLGKILGPAATDLSPEDQRLVNAAQGANIPLSPGQRTNNPAYKWADNTLLDKGDLYQNQLSQLTQNALNKAGADDPGFLQSIAGKEVSPQYADPATLTSLKGYIGGQIGAATAGKEMPVTPDYVADVVKVLDDYHGNTPPSMAKPMVDKMANDITQGSAIPGEAYQTARSKLGDLSVRAYKAGDSEYANALSGLQDALDQQMMKNLPPAEAQQLATSRGQYSNLKTLGRAMSSKDVNSYSGLVPPTALDTAAKSLSREGFAEGKGQMNDLARIGMSLMQKPAATGVKPSPTLTGFAADAASAIPKYLAGAAYNRPGFQDYLVNGAPMSPEMLKIAQALAARGVVLSAPGTMGNPNTPR